MNSFKKMSISIGILGSFGLILHHNFGQTLHNKKQTLHNKKYTWDQISKHSSETDLWVTYDNKVYDVTTFACTHPGGKDNVLMAAGDRLDSYWNKYPLHKTGKVLNILKNYEIGIIDPNDNNNPIENEEDNMNKNEHIDITKFKQNMIIHQETPYNSEMPLVELRKFYITPIELWFSRNHHPIPKIDAESFVLNICAKGKCFEFMLKDLDEFPTHQITTTIVCAGNNRIEMDKVHPTLGLKWNGGAISTGIWNGVLLRDLFKKIGISEKDGTYVHFTGEDSPYDSSINISQVFSDPVLIGREMNNSTINPLHGYPLRVIVPGSSGAKNVKWLNQITLSNEESYSTWQRGIAYKILPSNVKRIEDVTEEMKSLPTIDSVPVQSLIMEISDKDKMVKGYAYSGKGKKIVKVEVSSDGKIWHNAKITEGDSQPKGHAWAWVFWEYNYNTNQNKIIYSKATDEDGNVQPEHSEWNLRGILNNGWNTNHHNKLKN